MMKNIHSLLIAILAVATMTLVSCGNDDEPQVQPGVYPAPGTSTDILLDFQDAVVPDAVVFNSTADWSAEIFPANSSFEFVESKTLSQVSWLEINPFTGGAGEIHATIFVTPNRTYEPRYAVIRVNSPVNNLIFKVTQEGMVSGGGEQPTPNPGGSAE